MTTVVILVASLGLADSINPVTILIAVYLASTEDARPRLAGFVVGVFVVYLLGGLVLVLGPGELLQGAGTGVDVPHAGLVSVVAGAAAIILAVVLWARRARWRRLRPPDWALRPGSALTLGAVVTTIDLPTAFPYFGAIGVIVTSGASLIGQILLLLMFNLLYVLPPALVLVAHVALGNRCESALATAREAVERFAAPLLACMTLAGGCVLVVRGAGALA